MGKILIRFRNDPHYYDDSDLYFYTSNLHSVVQESADHTGIHKKTVVLLAECWNGAFDAGHFAAKLLFDTSTRIILLQTYQRPDTGVAKLLDLTQILKQTAEEDLSVLKAKLVKESGLPAGNIEKVVIEGDLKSVIKDEFSSYPNLSVVLGPDTHNLIRKGSSRKIVGELVRSKLRPLFLISDFITIIEESRIILIAEKEENISAVYLNFLIDTYDEENAPVEIITADNKKTIKMSKNTAGHFSNSLTPSDFRRNSLEQIFYNRVIRISPV